MGDMFWLVIDELVLMKMLEEFLESSHNPPSLLLLYVVKNGVHCIADTNLFAQVT